MGGCDGEEVHRSADGRGARAAGGDGEEGPYERAEDQTGAGAAESGCGGTELERRADGRGVPDARKNGGRHPTAICRRRFGWCAGEESAGRATATTKARWSWRGTADRDGVRRAA